jgi:sigma-B regulation protein RsbU (phosphoserine phosphatase)
VSLATAAVRERLVDRRERLAVAAGATGEEALADLLLQVDAALGRLDGGDWALCVSCKVPIEPELLDVAPAVTVCFECLTVEQRRALERDLEGAARVQRALLPPRRVTHDGWEVAWLWEPKGAVSGDHVDLLPPGGGSRDEPLHLVLGDVAGKGVAASLLQSHLHALFRALVHREAHQLPMGELVGRANRLFAAATSGAKYATLIAARLSADGTLELANAGHPRPLLADRRGVRPVEGSGLPLGLFPEAQYASHRLHLAPGQVLLLYSDGWTEASRSGTGGDEEYGIGRAAAALRRHSESPLPELLGSCREDARRFLNGGGWGDDLTLLAVRRTG